MFNNTEDRSSGHILRGDNVVQGAQSHSDVKNAEEIPPVKVYRDFHNVRMGPIGKKPQNWTFYDMLFDQGMDADFIRGSFHDWAIPEIQNAYMSETLHLTNIMSVKRISRGAVTTSAFHVEEYIYVALNGAGDMKSDAGSSYGTAIDRTTTLVCVYCGDPRRMNNLDQARIMYAVPMNSPWSNWCQIAVRLMNKEGGIDSLYDIHGDQMLEEHLQKKWFGPGYYFNRVIYPVASASVVNPYV